MVVKIDDRQQLEEQQYLIAISLLANVGAITGKNLVHYCGEARAVFKAPKRHLAKIPGVGESIINAIRRADVLEQAERELKYCQRHGIRVIPFNSALFPRQLQSIHDAPMLLFAKGNLQQLRKPMVGMVGTRKPSARGREIARNYASFFSKKGVNVVSGLAYGIDLESHLGSLKERGGTTAVLGHGLDMVYPYEHGGRAAEIVENDGLILSEYVTGVKPEAGNFPARNRIISGLSSAVVVVEATKTGGALITGRMAFDQDRDVFAIPGYPGCKTSEGCNILIRDQVAKLLLHPKEVLVDSFVQGALDFEGRGRGIGAGKAPVEASPEELQVLKALEAEEGRVDQLLERVKMDGAKLSKVLLELSLAGHVRQYPGGMYRRS